jgi:hypothetical protein
MALRKVEYHHNDTNGNISSSSKQSLQWTRPGPGDNQCACESESESDGSTHCHTVAMQLLLLAGLLPEMRHHDESTCSCYSGRIRKLLAAVYIVFMSHLDDYTIRRRVAC